MHHGKANIQRLQRREYEKDGKKDSFWTKIGVAFAHKNGGGFDIVLEAFPLNGRITLREPKADEPNA